MAHFYLSEIARMLGQAAPHDIAITGFEQDSRGIRSGYLFFALKGEKVDGHDFLRDVALQGGKVAVVSKEYYGDNFGLILIRVDDVMRSLQTLAEKVHALHKCRVVAVTGSVGKTTTKEFIASLLEGRFTVAKTPGNANSQVSVPLSILNKHSGEEVFVIEMGMSEKGEMQRLVQIAPPEIAVVTNISYAHVLFFPDGIEGIAYEKAQILSHPQTRLGVVSAQAAQFAAVRETGSCEKIIYGTGEYTLDRTPGETTGVRIIERGELSPPMELAFCASHLCEDFLAAVVVARAMGMSWSDIALRASKLSTFPKRFEMIVQDGIVFINDSYNANATSMKAALQNLPASGPGKKKIAVLGAMKELGPYTESLHKEVAECALSHVDHLLCLGEECQVMVDLFEENRKPAEIFTDLDAVKRRLSEIAENGDVVLLKGSRSNRLWLVLDTF